MYEGILHNTIGISDKHNERYENELHELNICLKGWDGLHSYGMVSSDDMIEPSTLSVTIRSSWLEDSSLALTSLCDRACSGVTSYGSLLEVQQQ